MATNDFLPFALGDGVNPPNTLTQAQWVALTQRMSGWQSGKASSAGANKAFRQAAIMAHLLGQMTADEGVDALDNGNTVTLRDALRKGLGRALAGKGARYINTAGVSTLTAADGFVLVDASAGNVTLNLPPANFVDGNMQQIEVVRGDSGNNSLTIIPNGSDKIDGAANRVMGGGHRALLVSSGFNLWFDMFKPLGDAVALEVSNRIGGDAALATNKVDKNSAFAQLGATQFVGTTNGRLLLPNSFTLQWGQGLSSDFGGSICTFPVAFPNQCIRVVVCEAAAEGWLGGQIVQPTWHGVSSFTRFNFQARSVKLIDGTPYLQGGIAYSYIAIGN